MADYHGRMPNEKGWEFGDDAIENLDKTLKYFDAGKSKQPVIQAAEMRHGKAYGEFWLKYWDWPFDGITISKQNTIHDVFLIRVGVVYDAIIGCVAEMPGINSTTWDVLTIEQMALARSIKKIRD
ncbi:hypothetical protein AYO42_04935 [Rhizomicrobium sp. SCGC AG-212-E05]|nr:hypothetical protein AYO42_04935 [Rhizomicrobium sp. SCGC AG-212-E05]